MENSNHFRKSITGITLEGFQVFDKPTHIPFGKLTFLFGPNSAGKSALQDALSIFQEVIQGNNTQVDKEKIRLDLERHWRRENKSGKDYVPLMSIRVKHCVVPNFDDTSYEFRRHRFQEDYVENGSWFSNLQHFETRLNFKRMTQSNKTGLHYEMDYELYSGESLLIGRIGSGINVNLDHPYFIFSNLSDEFYRLSLLYKDQIKFENGYLHIPEGVLGFHFGSDVLDDKREDLLSLDFRIFDKAWNSIDGYSDETLRPALKELSLMVHTIIYHVNLHRPLWRERVDASRRVPTRNDLTFKVNRIGKNLSLVEKTGYFESALESDANFIWLALAIKDDLEEKLNLKPYYEKLKNMLQNINDTLSGSLFIELGYQLSYSFRVILSESNSISLLSGCSLNSEEFGFEIKIFLTSEVSGNHCFEDVGSGIGYVLPVLCALNSIRHKFVTIQQPELHLHPALQAALGDVFIEAMSRGTCAVVETHSEHLLLRVLKRIRQTYSGKPVSDELAINADDVCVLYFNPSIDGTTTVKRLRISRDGEFLDRWPKGFFPERERELFDE